MSASSAPAITSVGTPIENAGSTGIGMYASRIVRALSNTILEACRPRSARLVCFENRTSAIAENAPLVSPLRKPHNPTQTAGALAKSAGVMKSIPSGGTGASMTRPENLHLSKEPLSQKGSKRVGNDVGWSFKSSKRIINGVATCRSRDGIVIVLARIHRRNGSAGYRNAVQKGAFQEPAKAPWIKRIGDQTKSRIELITIVPAATRNRGVSARRHRREDPVFSPRKACAAQELVGLV